MENNSVKASIENSLPVSTEYPYIKSDKLYGIGIILDEGLDSITTQGLYDNIESRVDNKFVVEKDENIYYDASIKDTNPEIPIRIFGAVTTNVSKTIVDEIRKYSGGFINLLAARYLWFDDKKYSEEYLKERLKSWMAENGTTHYWLVDKDTSFGEDILERFIRF